MSYSQNHNQQHGHLLDEIMEDLAVRFIFSCPDEEYQELDRLMFQFELAHWFYLDEYYDKNPKNLPKLSFKNFCSEMFDRFPPLQRYSHHVQAHIKSFQKYKNQVPVCGCLLLNKKMTKVLMVQAFGAKTWNFPRGKINKGESQIDCAARETREEIGFVPPQDLLDETRFIESTSGGKNVKLYIVPNVDENTQFQTQTTKEIAKIAWQSLSKMQPHDNKYRYVWPLIRRLKQWIRQNKRKHSPRSSSQGSSSNGRSHVNTGSDSHQHSVESTTSHQKSHSNRTSNNRRQKNHRNTRGDNPQSSSSDDSSNPSIPQQNGQNRRRSRNKKDGSPQKKNTKQNKKPRSSHPSSLQTSAPIDVKKLPIEGFPSASSVSASASPSFHNFSFDTNEMLRAIHG
mmetsp:Transcript_2726/g.10473  ORF Transcript_2726/g.10473 Transcript_2726/m.10473 type:complete len:397 (+) Transcript_2726:680-1870(+)